MKHELKCWPESFQAIREGVKTFDIRINDRFFSIGDTLVLQEWKPLTGTYTGYEIECRIPYIFKGGKLGLDEKYCVLSLAVIDVRNPKE